LTTAGRLNPNPWRPARVNATPGEVFMDHTISALSIWPFTPLLMMFVLAALVVTPFFLIFKKAGYSPWLSLLMVLPIVNFVMLYFLAFSRWPTQRTV
jgi:hypothetical protein